MTSIFHNGDCENMEVALLAYLQENTGTIDKRAVRSPRAIGDMLQEIVAENFGRLMHEYCSDCSGADTRRSMADFTFVDRFSNMHAVDVKTHREDTQFNMPNLISVKRLADFYKNDKNFFSILMIKYKVDEEALVITDVKFRPIEFLSWECLTIGALGWGQIQIANSRVVIFRAGYSRKTWMLELADTMLEFYPKEIAKIAQRVSTFTGVKNHWLGKADTLLDGVEDVSR